MNDVELPSVAVEADMRPAHRPQCIAMSSHRLFLGRCSPAEPASASPVQLIIARHTGRSNFMSTEVHDELSVHVTARANTQGWVQTNAMVDEFGEHFM